MNVLSALGLTIEFAELVSKKQKRKVLPIKLPVKIRISSYKQLKRLAWQIKDATEISPQEALDIYERNWRHIDMKAIDARERKFLEELLEAFGRERLLV